MAEYDIKEVGHVISEGKPFLVTYEYEGFAKLVPKCTFTVCEDDRELLCVLVFKINDFGDGKQVKLDKNTITIGDNVIFEIFGDLNYVKEEVEKYINKFIEGREYYIKLNSYNTLINYSDYYKYVKRIFVNAIHEGGNFYPEEILIFRKNSDEYLYIFRENFDDENYTTLFNKDKKNYIILHKNGKTQKFSHNIKLSPEDYIEISNPNYIIANTEIYN